MPAPYHRVCTECGDPFVAMRVDKKLCGKESCKAKRKRRNANGDTREYAVNTNEIGLVMQQATSAAVDDLPNVARELLADELRPVIREQLTADVLAGIAGMVRLMPLFQTAMEEDLGAREPVLDADGHVERDENGAVIWRIDYDRRKAAMALYSKNTFQQPGLAPQPETAEAAPITIVFPSMPAPSEPIVDVEIDEVQVAQLESGENRLCDICAAVKPSVEFVGTSSRCEECHTKQRERVEAAIRARQPQTI